MSEHIYTHVLYKPMNNVVSSHGVAVLAATIANAVTIVQAICARVPNLIQIFTAP